MSKNKQIKCDVANCKFNDNTDCCCTLDEIKVSYECASDDATEKKETICDSFKCNCGCKDNTEE